jgi:excisionase family DNA binding protein
MTILDRAAYPMEEARQLLGGLARSTLYAMEARGEIRVVRLGRRALIPADEIRRLVGSDIATHDDTIESS